MDADEERVDSRERGELTLRGGVRKGFVSDAVIVHSAARTFVSEPSPVRILAGTHLYHTLFSLAKQGEQTSVRSTRRLVHLCLRVHTRRVQ